MTKRRSYFNGVRVDVDDDSISVRGAVEAAAPASYRSAVTAADLMAAPGTVTTTKLTGVGSLTAAAHKIKVVAVNAYGRTTPTAGSDVTTETTNLGVRAAFAQVTGATHYDIYVSVDADPKWVGRITEAQRASGIIIDAVGSTAAGGAVNSVDIYVEGTGLLAGTTAAVNNAYVIPASPVDCNNYQYAEFDLTMTRTGDGVAPTLVLIPFVKNTRTSTWHALAAQAITFGGTTAAYNPNKQRLRVEVRDNSAVALAVAVIAGTGMSVDIDVTLS